MTTTIRTAEQLTLDERKNIVRSWETGTILTDKDQWVSLAAKELHVQEDTIRLVLEEDC